MKFLLRLARSGMAAPVIRLSVGWLLEHMAFVIPGERLAESPSLLAFFHPRPSYPFHVLLIPRRALSGLPALSADDADFMVELFAAVRGLVLQFELERHGYRLIANGGPYQDVPHLHFHLVSNAPRPERAGQP